MNIGNIWESDSVLWKIPITNTTDQSVNLGEIAASCLCTRIQPAALFIPAHETAELVLEIDLSKTSNGTQFKEFAVDIVAQRDDDSREIWTLRGNVHRPFVLESQKITFGDIRFNSKQMAAQRVKVRGSNGENQFTIEHAGDAIDFVTKQEPGTNDTIIEIFPRVGLSPGPFHDEIRLVPRYRPDISMVGSPPRIKVVGNVLGAVYAVPSSLFLGSAAVGETISRSVCLHHSSPFEIDNWRTKYPLPDPVTNDLSVSRIETTGSESADEIYNVILTVSNTGDGSEVLSFVAYRDDGVSYSVPVQVFWHGTQGPQ
ncbi:MAG: hypothetical protein WD669_10465 [Pirellulales bacterium]